MLARWWRRHARDADCGTVTAEFAVVLPCVAAVAILVLCLGRASIVSMNCQDAAAAGARAMAIDAGGEAKARAAAQTIARVAVPRCRSPPMRTASPLWCVARLRQESDRACCPPASWARQLGISDCDVHDSVLSVTVFERLPMRGKKGTTSVKHDVKQYVRRVLHVLKGADEGSGTISGVALIAIVAAMLGAVAMAGNLLLCVHRAQNTADLASVAAAQSLRDGAADPCAAASRTTSGNGTRLESCAIEGEDAVVAVRADTQGPFAPWVVRQSRAGPITCD